MNSCSESYEDEGIEQPPLLFNRNNSGWLVDADMPDSSNFMNLDSDVVLSCPPSWIHSEPTDGGLEEGYSSDGSSRVGQTATSDYAGSTVAPDSEPFYPPFSSSPTEGFSSSPDHKDFTSSSQTSDGGIYCEEDAPKEHYSEDQFTSKLHDLLLVVQQEQCANTRSKRLFRAPSEASEIDTDINEIRDQFLHVDYQPYSPTRAQGDAESSANRKRKYASSGLDGTQNQTASKTSADYLPFGQYRLIKRAASYQASMFETEESRRHQLHTPSPKRRRTSIRPLGSSNIGSSSPPSPTSPFKAAAIASTRLSRAASFRRADSLRAPSLESSPTSSSCKQPLASRPAHSDEKENHPPVTYHLPQRHKLEPYTPLPPANQCAPRGAAWVPTVPSTPSFRNNRQLEGITPKPRRLTRRSEVLLGLRSPVPIIAPPKDLVWRIPLSPSAEAKVRLREYLKRERRRDKRFKNQAISDSTSTSQSQTKITWERSLGIGRKTRTSIVSWLLTVMPKDIPQENHTVRPAEPCSQSTGTSSCPSSSSSDSSVTRQFDDPESELDFTLSRLLAAPSDEQPNSCDLDKSIGTDSAHRSLSDSARRKTTSEDINEKDMLAPSFNLSDQLQHSPETRFHAVWVFLRYFWLIDYGTQSNGFDADGECVYPGEDAEEKMLRSLLIWDAAVGALALSVKLHRDFLDPLLPVYADEYLRLAPHAIGLEDFENAQRDIFSALDYTLGDTPQPIMDELWRALPSLRQLLDFGSGRQHGWAVAMNKTWDKLFACLREPDVLGFSMSLLTTVALMDSVLDSFTEQNLRQSGPVCGGSGKLAKNPGDPHGRETNLENDDDEALGVLCDIQSLLGFTDRLIRWYRVLGPYLCMSSNDPSGNIPEGHDCSKCSIHPSCALFPRRSDGRIVLPHPQTVGGPSQTPAPSDSKNEDKGKERETSQGATCQDGHDASSSRSRGTPSSVAQTRQPGRNPACNCEDSKNRMNAASRAPPVVENYAQLSSLPEFRAFKLNRDAGSGNEGGSSSQGRSRPGTSGEWMQEIPVIPRTKKQNYVRSGTQDFYIRLYKGKDKEDPEGGQKS
ncbi:hypothetical protein CVT24_003692 [Panaeolus cyanescens]|uniref:Uncharacterized protein n=1 Tax=Panaeolus cyanescens TaxID=181874 RepID=A0A409VUL4_9AGAR|nr:hypothetical protein CVT24_003692 [Panaeolus cyanescens]